MRFVILLLPVVCLCAEAQVPPPTGGAERWEGAALDPGAGRVYVPGPAGVRVLDLEGRRVGAVAGTRGANSVALAPELGIGICSSGRTSTVHLFNLTSLVVEKDLRTTGGNPEAVVFDPATGGTFVSHRDGSITVVRPDAAGEYQVASIPAHQGC